MLTNHACIRVMKMALPLVEKGYEVHLITQKVTQYSDLLSSISVFHNLDQLQVAVKNHKDADVFHAHNEPSWFVTAVKEVVDKPVVLDVHDTMLLRRTDEDVKTAKDDEVFNISVDERNNFQLADGLVYVCDAMQKEVNSTYKIDAPNIVLPSFLPVRFYRVDFLKWIGGLVYEGRIDIDDELGKRWDFFQYANYLEAARECARIGIDFHVYTPRKDKKVREIYGNECFLHEPQNLSRLIKYLGGHDWGLVGNIKKYSEWENALPNKLFEYMAGCTPVVCINADESWNFIKDWGVGIKVDSFNELAERWSEHRKCRKNVIKHRMEWAMEKHIHLLEELYERIT
jgi:glycosyltransferase involved in cell wall biosynthesis